LALRDGDRYIVTGGAMKGQRRFFSRDEDGAVTGETARRWREGGAEDSQPDPFGQIN
jgi:hypothetical protein